MESGAICVCARHSPHSPYDEPRRRRSARTLRAWQSPSTTTRRPTSPTIDGIALTPKDTALRFPPTFDTVEEERLHRKQKLAGALRLFGRFGFCEGVAGHITVRDPEYPDHFWVNPFGMSFRHIRVSDLILVNHYGDVVYGDQPVNRAAFVHPLGDPPGAARRRRRRPLALACTARRSRRSASRSTR